MPRLTEQDKILMLSKLEEGSSINRVAAYYGLNKSTVLQVKKRWEQEGTATRRPMIIFLNTAKI
jgi:transposase